MSSQFTPPLPVPSPDVKRGGLCVGLATHHVKTTLLQKHRQYIQKVIKSWKRSRRQTQPCPMPTPMESLAKPKHVVRVAAWNVRTIVETGRAAQVLGEMERYKVKDTKLAR